MSVSRLTQAVDQRHDALCVLVATVAMRMRMASEMWYSRLPVDFTGSNWSCYVEHVGLLSVKCSL